MVKVAKVGREIVVTVVNKIGVLADMSKVLGESGINIEAMTGSVVDYDAKIMLVTNDNFRAIEALRKSGYQFIKENEVVIIELENKPGALKHITTNLASEGIDIKQIYGTTCSSGCPAKIILSTSNNERALVALKG